MPKKNPNPWLIAGSVLLLFIAINLVSAHLQSDCGLPDVLGVGGCADAIRRAGFPWLFWEEGGFVGHHFFLPAALIADAGLAVLISALAGWLARRALSSR